MRVMSEGDEWRAMSLEGLFVGLLSASLASILPSRSTDVTPFLLSCILYGSSQVAMTLR